MLVGGSHRPGVRARYSGTALIAAVRPRQSRQRGVWRLQRPAGGRCRRALGWPVETGSARVARWPERFRAPAPSRRTGRFFLDPGVNLYLTRPWLAPFAFLASHSQAYNAVTRIAARRRLGAAAGYADAIPIYLEGQHALTVIARGLEPAG